MCRCRSLQMSTLLSLLLIVSSVQCFSIPFFKHLDNDTKDFFRFVTRPDIRAPTWQVEYYNREAVSPGYWFVAPYKSLHQKQRGARWVGPYIYDQTGELVWSGVDLFDRFNIFDFRVVSINGSDMLTAIYKREDAGVILDSGYQIQKIVDWPGAYNTSNMHDFTVFANGTRALVLTKHHHLVSKEMAESVGVEECYVHSNGLQELDITGAKAKTLFAWNATDHIGLDEVTYGTRKIKKQCDSGWDIHHFNALDQFPDGDYLISSRHTDALYKISHENGSVVWRLGGVKSDFEFVGNSKFSRQHHARVREQNDTHIIVSLFDNAKGDGPVKTNDYSRGLVLALDMEAMTAETVTEFIHPEEKISTSRGSTQLLPNGNAFMGWTFKSRITEHTSDGKILMEAKLVSGRNTYRSYKYPWVGRPSQPPDVFSIAAKKRGKEKTAVYVSWNGATEVAEWQVYETDSLGRNSTLVASEPKQGFETSLGYSGFAQYIFAEAIDADGNSLGKSETFQTIPPDANPREWLQDQKWFQEHVENDGYDTGSDSMNWVLSTLSEPIAAYICGIATCLTVFACLWGSTRSKGWRGFRGLRWRTSKEPEYEPVWRDDEDEDLEEGDVKMMSNLSLSENGSSKSEPPQYAG